MKHQRPELRAPRNETRPAEREKSVVVTARVGGFSSDVALS